jgi:hypothetical protein
MRGKCIHNGLKIVQNYKEFSLLLKSIRFKNVTLRHCKADTINWEVPAKRTCGRFKINLGTGE